MEEAIRSAIASGQYGLARAVPIARYTGARRGDLVKLQRTARQVLPSSNSAMMISRLSGKRRVPVKQREAPELTASLANIPDAKAAFHRERLGSGTRRAGERASWAGGSTRRTTICTGFVT